MATVKEIVADLIVEPQMQKTIFYSPGDLSRISNISECEGRLISWGEWPLPSSGWILFADCSKVQAELNSFPPLSSTREETETLELVLRQVLDKFETN